MKLRARAEADKARRVDAILKAGREIWSRDSFDLTLADVAARAGIAKGTLYLYFANREQLLEAISERILSEYLDRVDGALAKRSRWTLSKVAELFAAGIVLPLLPQTDGARKRLARTAELIDARVAGLRSGDAARFVRCATAMLSGFARTHRSDQQYGVTALAHGMEKRR